MNGHCSKDIVTRIVYTYNHGNYFFFVLILALFMESKRISNDQYVYLMELQNISMYT